MKPAGDREEALFRDAVQQPAGPERKAFLDGACARDEALRLRLEALLQAHENPDSFLEPEVVPADKPTVIAEPQPEEGPGMLIGRYKLLEKIGEGGFGLVYVAEQREPVKRRVALKIIKLGMDTKQVVARFEAERQALALMDHPNIAKVLDAGATDNGRPYFVMELVKGIPITQYCDQNQLNTRQRLDLFILVCQAVQHAHQKGIIHRDLKPSNILVTRPEGDTSGVPKVIDFGIAKATQGRLTDATVHTQLNQFIGTPAYMSPEQAEMSGLDIDTRSDIYALGVLLYELLTGTTPFDPNELMASGLDQMRRTIREQEPVRPSTRLSALAGKELCLMAKHRQVEPGRLIHSVRGDLDWIVMKCLEKDRQRRYETASGLAGDVERHLKNEPVSAHPPSRVYAFQRLVRRKPAQAAFTALSLVALIGALGGAWWHNAKLNERLWFSLIDQAAVQRLANNRQRSLQLISQAAAMRRDGRLRKEAIESISLPGLQIRHEFQFGNEEVIRFSPDGQLVAVAGRLCLSEGFAINYDHPRVKVWNLETGKLLNEMECDTRFGLPAFSPNSSMLALPCQHDEVVLWQPRTGQGAARFPGRGALLFSPGGTYLALGETNQVVVRDLTQSNAPIASTDGTLIGFRGEQQLLVRKAGRLVLWRFLEGKAGPVASEDMEPVVLSGNGGMVALRSDGPPSQSRFAEVEDLRSGREIARFPNLDLRAGQGWLGVDGRRMVFQDQFDPNTIRVFNVAKARFERSLSHIGFQMANGNGNEGWFANESPWRSGPIALDPDGGLLAAEIRTGTRQISVWDLGAGDQIALLPEQQHPVWSLDGRYLAALAPGKVANARASVGSATMNVNIWELVRAVQTWHFGEKIERLSFERAGHCLAVNNALQEVVKSGSQEDPPSAARLQQGQYVQFGTDRQIWTVKTSEPSGDGFRVWQVAPTGKELPVLSSTNRERLLATRPDGKCLILDESGTLGTDSGLGYRGEPHYELWDLLTGTRSAVWPPRATRWPCWPSSAATNWPFIDPIIFSPDGQWLATTFDYVPGFAVLNAWTGQLWHNFEQPQPPKAGRWQPLTQRVKRFLRFPADDNYYFYGVGALAFSPDSRLIFSGAGSQGRGGGKVWNGNLVELEGIITIHEIATGRQVARFKGHSSSVSALAVSPDGRVLASGGADRMICLWEVPTGRELARWQAGESGVTALTFSPDGGTLASGSEEGVLKLWNLPLIRRELAALDLNW